MNVGIITIIFVLISVVVSIAAFNDGRLQDKLILWPGKMNDPKELYRLITSGFIHADTVHLAVNMFTLYFIGNNVELLYGLSISTPAYIVLYLAGIVVASLPSYFKHRHSYGYRSLGASGGVAAVLFAMVYFMPWEKLYFFGLQSLGVPAIIYAILYLLYSAYMARNSHDNINHDAHFWGAVFGFVFTLVVEPSHGQLFMQSFRAH